MDESRIFKFEVLETKGYYQPTSETQVKSAPIPLGSVQQPT